MMVSPARKRIAEILPAIAPVLVICAAAATLLCFPPDRYGFYPRCPFFTLFHLQCPGCGASRALVALLRGHLTEALHLNAIFTLALPFLLLVSARAYVQLLCKKSFHWPHPPQPAIYLALVVTAIFTVARNL